MKFKLFDVQNVAIGYVCIWATAPVLAYGDVYRYIAGAAVVVWLALEMVRPGGIVSRPTLPAVAAVFYIIYTGVIEVIVGASGSLVSLFQVWILLFFLIFYESRRDYVSSMRPLFWLMIVTLPIWLYSTYTAFDTYGSHVARDIVRSSELAQDLSGDGIGGYSLVYGTVLARRKYLQAAAIPRFLITKPVLFYLIFSVNFALAVGVVVRAGYSIAIILALFSLVISIVIRQRSLVYLMFLPLVAGLSFIVIQVAMEPALNYLQTITQGTSYAAKLRDVVYSLNTDQAAGTVDDRVERYTRSFSLFINHPFFGVLSNRDVGKHSAYLDGLARYGVFFGSIFIYLLLYMPLGLMRRMRRNFGLPLAVFAVMLLFPLLNSVFASLGVILFVCVPVACWMLGDGQPGSPPLLPAADAGRRDG